jgi:putative ABC transport system substrate-binding protein
VAIEYRWAEGQNDRLPALAAALVGRQVTVIAALGNLPTVLAAKAATTTIPIVFELPVDPVAAGIVSSLNRPGGNITGVTNFNVELGPKRLELLHELVPTATTIALLFDPTTSVGPDIGPKVLQEAAASLGLELAVLRASTERDLDTTFASLAQLRAGALMIAGGGLLNRRVEQLATLAARYAVPASHSQREFATAGGLMSYRSILADQYRLAGVYTGRILDGKKPADLPIQQPTKFELIINLRAAKALGLTVPLSLLASADEVIE